MINDLYENKFINEVINETVQNIFKDPKLSYSFAIQKAISYCEKKNKLKSYNK